MRKETLDRAVELAAGALAGGVVKTPEEAVEFAEKCYDRLEELQKRRGSGGSGRCI